MLPESARRRLKRTWAATFAEQVLPILLRLEPEFASLYATTGRPNWSVARMMGLCMIRELLGLGSDRETVEALSFDLRFQHALGVAQGDAYLSRRSLVDFRRRLAERDPDGTLVERVFDEVTSAALRAMGISTKTQRMDSTFIRSNIAMRGRTALLTEALEGLLEAVEKAEALDRVPEEFRGWATPEGWEGKHAFEEVARALWKVLQIFEQDAAISATVAYSQAKELFGQHVVVKLGDDEVDDAPDDDDVDDDGDDNTEPDGPDGGDVAKTRGRQVAKRKRRKKSKTQRQQGRKNRRTKNSAECFSPSKEGGVERRQSLHDPDARRGQKGTGYLAHLTETVGNDHAPEVITSVRVTPANASDSRSTIPLVEGLESKGRGAEVYLADAGYGTAQLLMTVEEMNKELIAPVRNPWSNRPDEMLTRDNFDFDDDGRVRRCPTGHAPLRHGMQKSSSCTQNKPHLHVFFDAETCNSCEHRKRCPVTNIEARGQTKLCVAPHLRRRDRRLREQKEPAFRQVYARRSGIEATNSEMKRTHRLDRLPIRGMQKVTTRVFLKAAGCNIKRWARYCAAA